MVHLHLLDYFFFSLGYAPQYLDFSGFLDFHDLSLVLIFEFQLAFYLPQV
jgi:hypothetical protein